MMAPLEGTLATGEEMLQAARAADWERVRTLQPIRERQLKAAFDAVPGDRNLTPFLDQVRRLMLQNREIVQLALRQRDEHAGRLGVLRTGHRACTAYAESRG